MSGKEIKPENLRDVSQTDIKMVHALLNNRKQVRWLFENNKIYIEIDVSELVKKAKP